jgi:predicted transposase/invertase (TIGR01784 family)
MRNLTTNKNLSPEEKWESLTFANNFLFCRILESEPEICRRLLEMLLHIKIERLEMLQSELTIQVGPDSHSIRCDVYAKDEGRVFDIEIQTTNRSDLPKRARYYQSAIDMDCLSRGEEYESLRNSYVIFLCLDDMFGKGLPAYFFENICAQDGKTKLGDGAYKVFFNASDYDKMGSDEERAFFKFLCGKAAEDDFTRIIEQKVARAKKNAGWRKYYMTWDQEIKHQRHMAFDEGKAEGLSEGREKGLSEGARQNAVENAKNLLKMNVLSPEQIAQAVGLSVEEISDLRGSLCAESLSV